MKSGNCNCVCEPTGRAAKIWWPVLPAKRGRSSQPYVVYFTDVRPTSAREAGKWFAAPPQRAAHADLFRVEGYIRKGTSSTKGEWAYFDAELARRPRSFAIRGVHVAFNHGGLHLTNPEALSVIGSALRNADGKKQLKAMLDRHFPPQAQAATLEYEGDLRVTTRPKYTQWMSRSELPFHAPFPGGFELTPPQLDAAAAESDARYAAKEYARQQWPGGMATVVGLVRWNDGSWSAAWSRYYSPS